jgi:hypothetical protein
MKKILLSFVPLALSLIALILLWGTFTNPHPDYYNGESKHPFGEGNAPREIRDSIMTQLKYFEKGYLERDLEKVEEYCQRLISKEDILILGTMPQEIFIGYEAATDLIGSDWEYWGDVYYLMDQSSISVENDVAMVSTIGYVEFDMSRFLVLPLRFSAVMVKEDADWKFHQMQFQFDLDIVKVLMILIVLLLSSLGFLIRSLVLLAGHIIKRRSRS